MSNKIRTIIASIGSTIVSIIADESGALKENEVVVRSPQAFLAMLDGNNGRPTPQTALRLTPTRRVAPRRIDEKAAPRPAAKKRIRNRKHETEFYHVKMRPGMDSHTMPRVGHWRLTLEEGARLEQAIRNKDNALSDLQLFILRHYLGVDVMPLSQGKIAEKLSETFPNFKGDNGRLNVKREIAGALRTLGMLHRRRRRANWSSSAE